jgi:diguanylate cyclase (GGDEF)-like protein
MGYTQATIFRLQGQHLLVRASNVDAPLKRFHVDKGHRIAQIFRSGDLFYDARGGEIVVPFEIGGDPAGLLQIVFDEEERVLYNESEPMRLAQEHLVLMMAESIGLSLSKLELEAEVRGHRIEDPVSGLFNRPFFRRRMIQETRRSRRYHRDLSLLLFGFDRLAEVAQESGEDTSDLVLQSWGKTFTSKFREIDVLARFGPTVFAVLLPETGLDEAIAKASDLREFISKARVEIEEGAAPREIGLTVSVGVAANLEGIADPDELVKRAEESLYEAKRQGRDRVCYFRDSVQTVRRRYTTSLE